MTTDEVGKQSDIAPSAPWKSPIPTKITDYLRKQYAQAMYVSFVIIIIIKLQFYILFVAQ